VHWCCQRRRFFKNASAEELNLFTECGPSGSIGLKADRIYSAWACPTREEVEQCNEIWKERNRIAAERQARLRQPFPPILRPDLGPGWWCTCIVHGEITLRPSTSFYGSGRCEKCGARQWQGAWEAYTDAEGRLAEKRWHVLRRVYTRGKILPTMCESDCALCERTRHLSHKPLASPSMFTLAYLDRLVTDTFGHESRSDGSDKDERLNHGLPQYGGGDATADTTASADGDGSELEFSEAKWRSIFESYARARALRHESN